jgi:hypothetical protein
MLKKAVALAAAVFAAAFLTTQCQPASIQFVLTNAAPDPMRSVTVHVTGASYSIGDVAPGASRTVRVRPSGESHIELSYADGHRTVVDCYFEPGYGGKITAVVAADKVVSVNSEVKVRSLF